MKSARAYKSALYSSDSFWDGHAVDRQITGPREISNYWIQDFLTSELRTTGPAGTKRLADAIRNTIQSPVDLDIKQELISAANLLPGQHGRRRNTNQLVGQLGISERATTALKSAFTRPDLMSETFEFDRDEFEKHIPYRAVEMDNGGLLIADFNNFSEIFQREELGDRRVRYATEGRVTDDRLRKRK
jgi:hypothetical protein